MALVASAHAISPPVTGDAPKAPALEPDATVPVVGVWAPWRDGGRTGAVRCRVLVCA
jgi:hypothetical protein